MKNEQKFSSAWYCFVLFFHIFLANYCWKMIIQKWKFLTFSRCSPTLFHKNKLHTYACSSLEDKRIFMTPQGGADLVLEAVNNWKSVTCAQEIVFIIIYYLFIILELAKTTRWNRPHWVTHFHDAPFAIFTLPHKNKPPPLSLISELLKVRNA